MNKYQRAFERVTDWFHSYTIDGVRIHEQKITDNYKVQKQNLLYLVEEATRYETNINIFKDRAKQEIKRITIEENVMIIEGKKGAIHRFYGDGFK